jgi:hypothetical protein
MSQLPEEEIYSEQGDTATVRPEATFKPEPGDYFEPYNVPYRDPYFTKLLATLLDFFELFFLAIFITQWCK